ERGRGELLLDLGDPASIRVQVLVPEQADVAGRAAPALVQGEARPEIALNAEQDGTADGLVAEILARVRKVALGGESEIGAQGLEVPPEQIPPIGPRREGVLE